eukprot:9758711-Alexandrium_andersonii.AAC.1
MPQEAMKTRVGLINVLYVSVCPMCAMWLACWRAAPHLHAASRTHALLEHELCICNAARPRFHNTPGRPAHTDGRT